MFEYVLVYGIETGISFWSNSMFWKSFHLSTSFLAKATHNIVGSVYQIKTFVLWFRPNDYKSTRCFTQAQTYQTLTNTNTLVLSFQMKMYKWMFYFENTNNVTCFVTLRMFSSRFLWHIQQQKIMLKEENKWEKAHIQQHQQLLSK